VRRVAHLEKRKNGNYEERRNGERRNREKAGWKSVSDRRDIAGVVQRHPGRARGTAGGIRVDGLSSSTSQSSLTKLFRREG